MRIHYGRAMRQGRILRSINMKILKIVVAVVIGGGLGFLYYWKVGCRTGACPITSNPFISTAYGAVMGALLSGAI